MANEHEKDNTNFVTHQQLNKAFGEFRDSVKSDMRDANNELRAQINSDRNDRKPNTQNAWMVAALILGAIYFLWGKEAAKTEHEFEKVYKTIQQSSDDAHASVREKESRLQLLENWMISNARDSERREADFVFQQASKATP